MVDGDGLLTPPPFLLFMLLMVVEMVCLAACFALSVDTKLLTRSFRFPFISDEDNRRSNPPPPSAEEEEEEEEGEDGEVTAAADADDNEPLLATADLAVREDAKGRVAAAPTAAGLAGCS